ncbi:pseudouridine synthase [Puia sp.]|jgi:23S rRNA pseudouridine2457 synthase|uniref:pseudouridine synthase n=1 Tax=Puia sp. TaxID=2045100 RepID=UPI002F40CB37
MPANAHQYYIVYKPFQVLSQFTSTEGKATLKDFFPVPVDCYPVGRLDFDSEGLLILTNDPDLNNRLLNPLFAHDREYWAQVEGAITPAALHLLSTGVTINIDGKPYRTLPARASTFETPPPVPDRHPPIRFRATIPTSWISLVLREGKNRQVRKMTAQVGFPTLRLIRHRIEKLDLNGLASGEMRSMTRQQLYSLLFAERNH